MPEQCRRATTGAGPIQTRLSQAQRLHKACAHPFHVVLLVTTTRHTQAHAHVLLFSSDLPLAAASLVDSYGLRCQIACNFRDATQSWGLEDLMHVTPTGVTQAAHLSLFLVHVASRLRTDVHPRAPAYSRLDLQADWRGSQYVEETIKMLPEKPAPILGAKILHQVAGLGRMHTAQPFFRFS